MKRRRNMNLVIPSNMKVKQYNWVKHSKEFGSPEEALEYIYQLEFDPGFMLSYYLDGNTVSVYLTLNNITRRNHCDVMRHLVTDFKREYLVGLDNTGLKIFNNVATIPFEESKDFLKQNNITKSMLVPVFKETEGVYISY